MWYNNLYYVSTSGKTTIRFENLREVIAMEGNNEQQNQVQGYTPSPNTSGHGKAVASLVLGIIGVVFWFFGAASFISLILGVIGIILASSAKKDGNTEGLQTAGFVLSLIALIGGAIAFIACVACVGGAAAIGNSLN